MTTRDNAYPIGIDGADPALFTDNLSAQEGLDAARANRGVAGRLNIGVVRAVREDNVDCQVFNADGSSAIRRFCQVMESPHPIAVGDNVLVIQSATGVSFAKGLVENHQLSDNQSHPISQNTFLARVLAPPTPTQRSVPVVPIQRPSIILQALIPRHIFTPNPVVSVTLTPPGGMITFDNPLKGGTVVAIARDTGPPTAYEGETGAAFYLPKHWITAVFYDEADYANQPETPHVGLRLDASIAPSDIGGYGPFPMDNTNQLTPTFSKSVTRYSFPTGSASQRKIIRIELDNPNALAVDITPAAVGNEPEEVQNGERAPGQGAGFFRIPSNQRWFRISPAEGNAPTIYIIRVTSLQSAKSNAFYISIPA